MLSKVPDDVGALLEQHAAFLPYIITKIIRHHLSEDDLQDLTQDILLTLHARKYLDRCRAYEQTCLVQGKPYSFLASLRTFVERLTKNHLRNRHAAKRDPRVTTSLSYRYSDSDRDKDGHASAPPAALIQPATQANAAIASADVQRLRAVLTAGRRVIGGLPAVTVVDAALVNGGDLDKYARRRLREALPKESHASA